MKRERYEKLREIALRVKEMAEEAFGKERVFILVNPDKNSPVDISVGEIGKDESYYIYCGEEWVTDSRKYNSRHFGTVGKFKFEEEAS